MMTGEFHLQAFLPHTSNNVGQCEEGVYVSTFTNNINTNKINKDIHYT